MRPETPADVAAAWLRKAARYPGEPEDVPPEVAARALATARAVQSMARAAIDGSR